MVDRRIGPVLEDLCGRSTTDGGFAPLAGAGSRVDATAWASLALAWTDRDPGLLEKARSRLAADQSEDGRLSISHGRPEACWPTALAILAWHRGSASHLEAQGRAVQFLLQTTGVHWPRVDGAPVAHDTAIRGWPWIERTHSWVEPTALAVMALTVAGHGDHDRVREASLMLLDRQLPKGGWNYGNTFVFGKELLPMADATGMALGALAERTPRESVAISLQVLAGQTMRSRSPLSLGWGLLGLGAWGEYPGDSLDRVLETVKKQEQFGPFDTTLLSLLVIASSTDKGLVGGMA